MPGFKTRQFWFTHLLVVAGNGIIKKQLVF